MRKESRKHFFSTGQKHSGHVDCDICLKFLRLVCLFIFKLFGICHRELRIQKLLYNPSNLLSIYAIKKIMEDQGKAF